ncbi:SUKH-4 family immunity protein [Streptomyces sp. GZWMJZ-114]|uniref:SUKH-4 family immunity protein n=1 Tax=Streptomyces sp. GZWMJZ-114 TaxID=2494734 RepID=UPI00101289A0|nr:SUKH-4 family immunity protein [Streptomyces sp. GZWMJZ-114]
MVTFAQAQERGERWINGDVPRYQHREVRVREFGLGFVVWAEDRAEAGPSDGGGQRVVIARDGRDVTLWPDLPVAEVIRRYEEEYGAAAADEVPPEPPERIDLNQTSFLLSPPEWLQEAADQLGIPGGRADASRGGDATAADAGAGGPAASGPAAGGSVAGGSLAGGARPAEPVAGEGTWEAADTTGAAQGRLVVPPDTVFTQGDEEAAGGPGAGGVPASEARTRLLDGTVPAPPGFPEAPGVPGPPAVPPRPAPGAEDLSQVATSKATPRRQERGPVPPPGPAPAGPLAGPAGPGQGGAGTGQSGPGAGQGAGTGPGAGTGQGAAAGQGGSDAGVHHAPTVFAPPPPGPVAGTPATPPPPPASTPPDGVAHAATVLSRPSGPAAPPPPPSPAPQAPVPPRNAASAPGPVPRTPGPVPPSPPGPVPPSPGPVPATPPGPVAPPQSPQGYGYPRPGVPTVGPGYQAVLRFRAPDGSEQQVIRRSAPGLPHPEWQILHELRAMNVPPQQVLELHTELESCELPGAYCARMIRETFPQARITSIAPYGTDHASRQRGMAQLLAHQGELHQVADGPARPAPVRVPLPRVPQAPAVPLDEVARELAGAFGPQGVFRFEPQAVARAGVPEVVAASLTTAGLPFDMGPFFWAQAQPGRPVPTLAELAQERGVAAAPDAGTYLVVGSDFGKALCVQYGTGHIVAVPVEAGPGGAPVPPQFVNSGLVEFTRCLAMLGRMWRLRYGLTQEQAGRWTVDFQAELAALDPAALASAESWWSVILEQLWDGLS